MHLKVAFINDPKAHYIGEFPCMALNMLSLFEIISRQVIGDAITSVQGYMEKIPIPTFATKPQN